MEVWKVPTAAQKKCILRAAKVRFWKRCGYMGLACLFVFFMAFLFTFSDYEDELNSLMKENLGYNPNDPPYAPETYLDPEESNKVGDMLRIYYEEEGFTFQTPEDKPVVETVKRKTKKDIDDEIIAARKNAEKKIGKYENRLLTIYLIISSPALFLAFVLYLSYKKEQKETIVYANAVCIQKEKIWRRSWGSHHVWVKLSDGTVIEAVPVGFFMYDEINYNVPLIVTAPVDNFYSENRRIDVDCAHIILEKDWEVGFEKEHNGL